MMWALDVSSVQMMESENNHLTNNPLDQEFHLIPKTKNWTVHVCTNDCKSERTEVQMNTHLYLHTISATATAS